MKFVSKTKKKCCFRVNVNMTHSVPRCDDQNFHSVTQKPMDTVGHVDIYPEAAGKAAAK